LSKRRTDYSHTHSQHFVKQKDDGYIRMRCRECGTKLKAKKDFAGQMFTCKYCKTPNVLPFLNEDGVVTDTAPADPQVGHDATALSDWEQGERWAPQFHRAVTRIQEIDELMNAIFQKYQDAFSRAQNMFTDHDMAHEQHKAELEKVRRDLDMDVRVLVREKRDALKEKVAKLRNHPMAKSVAIREQLDEAIRHHTAFNLFAEVLFD